MEDKINDPLNGGAKLVVKAMELIKKFESEPEPVEIWNGIVEGSKGLFVGVSKTGKTTFAENFAISLTVGKLSFYGKEIKGGPKKVLFINLEESPRMRSSRLRKQISRLNPQEMVLFSENYLTPALDFIESVTSDKDWKILRDCIEESDAEIVVIDSLTHLFQGQIESSQECVKFVNKFREYVTSSGKTIIVIHHNTKGNDRPIEQDNIAGSRVILQEFEYALGFANIPSDKGGKYSCYLFNKYIEVDNSLATVYKIDKDRWIEAIGEVNKNDLYDPKVKVDYREDSTNKDLIYTYILSRTSPTSPTSITTSMPIKTIDLKAHFVDGASSTMVKDTFYANLKKLEQEGKITKTKRGEVELSTNPLNTKEDGKADENSLQSN